MTFPFIYVKDQTFLSVLGNLSTSFFISLLNMNSFKVSLHLLDFSLKCCWHIRLSLESPGLTTEAKRTFNKELPGGLMYDSQWLDDSCIVVWDVSHTLPPYSLSC